MGLPLWLPSVFHQRLSMAGSHRLCSGEVRAGHELLARSRCPQLIVALPARLQAASLDAHLQGEIILNVVKHCILFQWMERWVRISLQSDVNAMLRDADATQKHRKFFSCNTSRSKRSRGCSPEWQPHQGSLPWCRAKLQCRGNPDPESRVQAHIHYQ